MTDAVRVVKDKEHNGMWNMAVDEAVFGAVLEKKAPSTIRIYGWDPPCVSLGYFQSANIIDMDRCKALGIDIVRRTTGGKTVFHDQELTYSIVMPIPEGKKGSVIETFKMLNQGIINGLSYLGIEAVFHELPKKLRGKNNSDWCFNSSSRYEISFQEKKILGSAQFRKGNFLLQHGSLPYFIDKEKMRGLLINEKEISNIEDLVGINDAAKKHFSPSEVEEAIIKGFFRSFDGIFFGKLTEMELERSKYLLENKYSCDSWNYKR